MGSLREICKHVLLAHSQKMEDIGHCPYSLIKDVLFHIGPDQLLLIEKNSPHIANEDGDVWKKFISEDFPLSSKPPFGSSSRHYRELYFKRVEEREQGRKAAGNRLKNKYATIKDEKGKRQLVVLDKMPEKPPPKKPSKANSLVEKCRNDSRKKAMTFRSTAFQTGHIRPRPLKTDESLKKASSSNQKDTTPASKQTDEREKRPSAPLEERPAKRMKSGVERVAPAPAPLIRRPPSIFMPRR